MALFESFALPIESGFQIAHFYGANVQIAAFPGGGFIGEFMDQANISTPPTVLSLKRFDTSGNLL
jgi:hypothetical protein